MNTYCILFRPDTWWRLFQPASIEEGDPCYGSYFWIRHDRSGESLPLRADRLHRTPQEEEMDGQDCSGIRCQIWKQARVRSPLTHRLSGSQDLLIDALPSEMIVHGNCGEYGRYTELAILHDKVGRYLFEFDSESYTSLALPDIPRGASNGTIHGLTNAQQVCCLHISHINSYTAYITYYLNKHIYCIYTGLHPPHTLLDTLQVLPFANDSGHLRMLRVQHKAFPPLPLDPDFPVRGWRVDNRFNQPINLAPRQRYK